MKTAMRAGAAVNIIISIPKKLRLICLNLIAPVSNKMLGIVVKFTKYTISIFISGIKNMFWVTRFFLFTTGNRAYISNFILIRLPMLVYTKCLTNIHEHSFGFQGCGGSMVDRGVVAQW